MELLLSVELELDELGKLGRLLITLPPIVLLVELIRPVELPELLLSDDTAEDDDDGEPLEVSGEVVEGSGVTVCT